MKKKFLLLLAAIFFVSSAFAQLKEGESPIRITKNTYQELELSLKTSIPHTLEIKTNSGIFSELIVPGFGKRNTIGEPKLPVMKKLIEVPVDAEFQIEVLSYDLAEYDLNAIGLLYPIIPTQRSISKSEDASAVPFVINDQLYETDAFNDDELVKVEYIGTMRGINIARLELQSIRYNPVSNTIRIYDNMKVRIRFKNADLPATLALKEKTHSPFFAGAYRSTINYKPLNTKDVLTKYPVKYVIVSDPMFQSTLQPFINWKTQKGFTVIEAYTNNPAVGTTTSSIKSYLQGLYNAGTPTDPAPSFVLFVGDVAQIPAYNGTSGSHVTDLYYCEYTNDLIPEMYYGRFSAQNISQLIPQIDKTLMHEQYTFPNPAFLGDVVMVAGVDASMAPTYGNGQINYGTANYFNASNGINCHTYLYPASGSSSSQIIANISNGVGFGNYTAHCSSNGWADPSFVKSDINTLNNGGKYGVLVGNCCLSNKFDDNETFGEALLRASDRGAVGYIGASNSSYWNEDYYFSVGYRSNISANPTYSANAPGFYDLAFHTHNEPFSEWFITADQMIYSGNLGVVQGGSSITYYWEIYHLMGDPSLMPYFGIPSALTVNYNPVLFIGATSFTVTTEPYAYVALSMNGTLYGAVLADSLGNAVINMSSGISTPGTADVVVTAQNKIPYIGTVTVTPPSGPYVVKNAVNVNDAAGNNNQLADFGENILLDVTLENVGIAVASTVTASISTLDGNVSITDATESFGSINNGSTVSRTGAFAVTVNNNVPDQHTVSFDLSITDGSSNTWSETFNVTLQAPELSTGMITVDDASGNNNGLLDAGETVSITVGVPNIGHSTALSTQASLSSTSSEVTVTNGSSNVGDINAGSNGTATFTVTVSPTAQTGAVADFNFNASAGAYSTSLAFGLNIGMVSEDWETGDFTRFPWVNTSSTPWTIVSSNPYEGTYCAKSGDISHSQTTTLEITMNVLSNDSISFYKKVSCEDGSSSGNKWDFLEFFIDGTSMDWWDGNVSWSREVFPVSAGTRTFTWTYEKDYYVSSGQDCAWLDYIVFPPSNNNITGINSTESLGLAIVPNPANEQTEITIFKSEAGITGIKIYNNTGALVYNKTETYAPAGAYSFMVNTSEWNAGIYFVETFDQNQRLSKRLIVTH